MVMILFSLGQTGLLKEVVWPHYTAENHPHVMPVHFTE